jgi:hypothetical protein
MREIFVAVLTENDFNHGVVFSYVIGCFLTREEAEEKSKEYLKIHIEFLMTEDHYTEDEVDEGFTLEWKITPCEMDI